MRRTRLALASALLAVVTIASAFGAAPPASAAIAHQDGWHTICAREVTLRAHPASYTIDVLLRGQSFYILSHAGEAWVYGFETAANGTWFYGWVQNGWFC